ncbi:carboxypeptidase-like regulatory domain-containing protein [Aureibaculum algae]|uniref:Carboxypeptidase-like regulatory domain-containing protein n=1 Tax=Aureibaculum algae TaxID=2584122 RepID=A0A5B7TVL2_9FLAO|nr:carboxypeptidase-like regulatory domain-containing protein [Aureibaculum algae]QCX40288.1 carboxypeptidase-like regulatory domain-containing protein [Aureibaculum algae]
MLFSFKNYAQSITGKVLDKENTALEYVAVALLNPQDSVLVSYTTTNKYGDFELNNLDTGSYIFQLNFVGFDVYQKKITFQEQDISFGSIILGDTTNTLDEVVLQAIIPITIKKDTISYNTKAFKIRIEDSAEDLL